MGRILGSQRLSLAPLGPSREPQRLSPPHGGPWEDPARGQSPLMPALCLQVSETTLRVSASAHPADAGDQTTEEKQSTDSGAYSIGH